MNNQNIVEFLRKNRTALVVIVLGLFLIELELFAFAAMKSGRKSWLQIADCNGVVIHETDGDNLSEFNKYYFERTFGPLENYEVKLVVQNKLFPFRAWFVAALGVPIGIVLLLGFIFKAYLSIFQIKNINFSSERVSNNKNEKNGLIETLDKVSRTNIFVIGFLVFLVVVAYWIIPDAVNSVGRAGISTIIRFKWFFILVLISSTMVGMWVIYLRYRLAKINIENHTEIEKYRLGFRVKSDVSLLRLRDSDSDNSSGIIEHVDVETNHGNNDFST